MEASAVLKVPFLNERIAFTHASLVLYTKLPSIQLVIRLICRKEFRLALEHGNYNKQIDSSQLCDKSM